MKCEGQKGSKKVEVAGGREREARVGEEEEQAEHGRQVEGSRRGRDEDEVRKPGPEISPNAPLSLAGARHKCKANVKQKAKAR